MTPALKLKDQVIHEEDLARLLGITKGTLRNRIYAGEDLPGWIGDRHPRIWLTETVYRWMKSREGRK